MSTRILLLALLACLAASPGCKEEKKNSEPQLEETLAPGTGPQASEREALPKFAPPEPKAGESRYVIHVKDAQGRAIARAMVHLLIKEPEGLDLFQPRRKQTVANFRSPVSGRVIFLVQSDNLPKVVWVGGDGFHPLTKVLPESRSQLKHEETITVEILPIMNVILEDHQGNRESNGIVTMRPVGGGGKLDGRMETVYKRARRTDDLGELKLTRKVGRYEFIATKENGTCRFTKILDWDGSAAPQVFRLPERTPGKPDDGG